MMGWDDQGFYRVEDKPKQKYKCSNCGRIFEDKPIKHGNVYVYDQTKEAFYTTKTMEVKVWCNGKVTKVK
jgi:transposase-like protein